ncbi:hypothetical protein IAT38_002744 [Cryptococcus sp. DSM 104549]
MDNRLAFLRQPPPVSPSTTTSAGPISCTFEHRTPGAAGNVELNYWPARRGDGKAPAHLLVFILGNPGLLGYYPPFLTHFHALLPPTHAILATSHIGHSTSVPGPAEPLNLKEQVESKAELVRALRGELDAWSGGAEGEGRPELALMGHSVGAYMLCEVMKRLNVGPERPVSAGYLLFPTLGWISNTWNGWTLWPIFHRPVRPLLPILSPLLRPLLPFLSTLPPTSRALVSSPEVITHVMHLSAAEMRDIREPDLGWFKTQGVDEAGKEGRRGLYGIWAGGNLDGWVGQDGPLIRDCLGGEAGGRVKLVDGVPHAFCLTQENSERVAEIVAGWINPAALESAEVAAEAPVEGVEEPVGSGVLSM